MLNEHVSVKATRNLSDKILADSKGVVVFVYADPRLAYEVEFFDDEAYTLGVLTVEPSDIELIQ